METAYLKELEQYYSQFSPRTYKKGEVLIRADDDPGGIFLLRKGYVRKYVLSKKGLEFTVQILKSPSLFPIIWAINGSVNTYYFEAMSQVEAVRAPKDKLMAYMRDKPATLLRLTKELLEDYAETLSRMESLVFGDAYRRVITILLYIAKHFGEKRKEEIIIPHRFTQTELASLMGIARETVSTEMVKLEKKGMISYVNHSLLFKKLSLMEVELHAIG